MRVRAVVTGYLAAALAFSSVACGDGDGNAATGADTATTLTVYSSLPLRGPAASQSLSIVNAEKLALEDAGGRAGPYIVKYVSLDDSAGPDGWEPQAVGAAARKAAQDRTTIGYLGDLDSGASAISIPVSNEAGVLQISPSNTAVGLTKAVGADKGEPEKYYPSGTRSFGRVIPADDVQAAAQIQLQRDEGCRATYLVHANEFYGKGIADQIERQAPARGLRIVANESMDPRADTAALTSLVEKVVAERPACVFFGGRTASAAVALFTALHRALPRAKLFGADGVAETSFTAALPPAVAAQVRLTTPSLDARMYPPAGQAFVRRYRARFGAAPEPLAIFGYEAMSVLLQAVRDAGPDGDDRAAVTAAFFAIRDRRSVLGSYSVDAGGDTSLRRFGVAVIKDGRLSYTRVIDPGPR